jgi:hypothetical protein
MKRSLGRKSHKSTSSRKHRGGESQPYSSAATYQNWMLGSENDQYGRVFDQSGPNTSQSNAIMANANSGSVGYLPYQRAGKGRRSRGGRRSKKGGFLGSVVNQAIVPFGLVGLNQYYGKRRGNKSNKTRKMYRR